MTGLIIAASWFALASFGAGVAYGKSNKMTPSASRKASERQGLKPDDIVFGGLYRAKRPTFDFFGDVQNDRAVIYIDHLRQSLQYDSYTVANGRHYPTISVEAFARWAKCRINEDGTPYTEPPE